MSGEVWRIEKIVPGGAGMARLEGGLIGFAEGALPGEAILVEGREARKGHVRATSFRVLEVAPARVTPPCPYASQGCGCDFMHVSSEDALAHKVEALGDALVRIGKFTTLPAIDVHPSARALGYRSRVRLHIAEDGRVGYHERGSHRVLEILSCKVASPELELAIQRLRAAAREHARAAGRYREAELRVAPAHPTKPPESAAGAERPACWLMLGEASSAPATRRASGDPFLQALREHFDVVVGDARSDSVQRWPLTEAIALLVPPRAFVQVNWAVNLEMIAALVRGAERAGAKRFLDLYAGAGNFTLALLAAGLTGVAVESDPDAVRACERALAEQALTGGRVLRADSRRALSDRALAAVDLVILDPPRRGAKELLTPLVAAGPSSIAYFSCDPVTLARDLERLTASGYTLESLDAFDMFPGTHHIETLAWLGRAQRD